MKLYWTRIENWLQENAPHLLELLNEGATQSDIEQLEIIIEKKLPEEFVQFCSVHNGQDEEKGREGLIPNAEELLSTHDIIGQYKIWKSLLDNGDFEDDGEPFTSDPDKGVKDNWWNPFWVPFTYDGSGNHICIDLDPAPGGNIGQVIRMWHDSAYRELYASSFGEFISNYISGLETGKYVYAKEFGVVKKDSPFNKP
jgi:cell wall assembly regulator SMI1